jgi:CyaY protein
MDDQHFDKIAEAELDFLERKLGELDPDEVEVSLASGVLTLAFADGAKVVVNSHRAAREIWMADGRSASRRAYHFAPVEESGKTTWRVGGDELRATISRVLTEKLGREVPV